MEDTSYSIDGLTALQTLREISRMPEGVFTLAFFPYSRTTGKASARLKVKQGCRYRTQLPGEQFSINGENLLLFTDGDGQPRMCYRILVRYIGFPHDGFTLHRIDWLGGATLTDNG